MNRISLTVPNIITMFRFALVPVTAILICYGMTISALVTYIIACTTDIIDGFIARRLNQITEEGILLDPLADKLMAVFAIVAFTVIKVVPPILLIVILAKEALMIGGAVFLYYRKIVTPSNIFGKGAAVLFNAAIALIFFYKLFEDKDPWHIYVLSFATFIMVVALLQYAYFNMYKNFKKEPSKSRSS